MIKQHSPLRRGGAIAFMLLLFHLPVQAQSGRAKGDQYTMQINVSGTVVANGSCHFATTSGNDVNYGDVGYSTLNGTTVLEGSFKKTLANQLQCSGDTAGHPQLKLDTNDGNSLAYQGTALLPVKTSSGAQMTSLGIRLLVNDKPQDVGEWFDIQVTSPPTLAAELVQTGDGKDFVNGDQFTANATLTMAFN
ncbi:MrfF [Enterobacter sp. DRP3]|nr:MrfF [Enterobacter sp. DRP3]